VTLAEGWATALDALVPGFGARALYADERSLLFVVGVLLFWLVAVFLYLLIAFRASRDAETRALELTLLAREAELRALRAQIDPHFLFNSLNSISALTSSDAAAARRMCLLLADFLRATLRLGATEHITLSDEFDLAETFLAIERVRLGPRLLVTRDASPESDACLVPPLLLQPLVENAVVHGIAHLLEGGTVRMSASRQASTLTIALENPCDPDRPRRQARGIGLDLLRKRVATQFGEAGDVRVEEASDRFRVEVRIPAVTAA
jgi:LytS/YehU family sensor histidine kinase